MPTLKLNGNSRCQCSGCEEFFNSEGAFTKHRTGQYGGGSANTRRCRSPQEMLELGMAKNDAGFWVTAVIEGGFWGKSPAAEDDDLIGSPETEFEDDLI